MTQVGANPPTPPFTKETAIQKVKNAENAWNSRDPVKVSMAYTPDCEWRNRTEVISCFVVSIVLAWNC